MSKWEIGTKLVHDEKGPSEYGAIGAAHGQAYWEAMGWRAVVPAPPVERKLATKWIKADAEATLHGWVCDATSCQEYAPYKPFGRPVSYCATCAAERGAFASPEPKAEAIGRSVTRIVIDECQDADDAIDAMAYAMKPMSDFIKWQPAPVVEKPRPLTCWLCSSSERVAMRITRNAATTCERCYLQQEAKFASLMVEGDKLLADPKPRPAAHPGVTPVVFGLGVGIWASRGMAKR